jgi:predicted nuclease of predicted toxin-antitoxin system
VIVSKDSDFQERSVLYGFPPKFIWLRAANCPSVVVEMLLRSAQPTVDEFLQDPQESCLILSIRLK